MFAVAASKKMPCAYYFHVTEIRYYLRLCVKPMKEKVTNIGTK